MTKNIKFVITTFVFSSSKCTKIRFRPGPAGRAYDAPPDPLVSCGGGYPLPISLPARRLLRLELGAYGALVLRSPSTQNPGYHRRRSSVNFRGAKIFARKICIKNHQNARILNDSCPKNYHNIRFFIFA